MAKWIQKARERMEKKGTTGVFSAAAKRHGMSTPAYAGHVLADPNASGTLKKRANFARNVAK